MKQRHERKRKASGLSPRFLGTVTAAATRSIFAVLFVLLVSAEAMAITSVTVTPAPTTMLSDGRAYYLSGIQYTFRVQAVDPAATQQTDWNQILLTFPGGKTCTISIDTDTVVGTNEVIVNPGDIVNNTVVWTNPDYNITVTFTWGGTQAIPPGLNTVRADVTSDISAAAFDAPSFAFYVITSAAILNFAQGGVAADGKVNPYHDGFNVTGAVVYNITGAGIADRIWALDPLEITGTTLFLEGATTGLIDNNMADNCSYAFPAGTLGPARLLPYEWRIVITTATGLNPMTSANALNLTCDRVRITAIQFLNGGGVDAPNYYRSVNVPGTQVQVTANMEFGGGAMDGIVTIRVRNLTDGAPGDFTTVQILSGANIGVGNVPFPNTAVPVDTTRQDFYRIEAITGGAYGGDTLPNGQSDSTRLIQVPPNPAIYWDNGDEPGLHTPPFTPWGSVSATAGSLTFTWTPLAAAPPYEDFYTYRLYYRVSSVPGPAGPWFVVDRTTPGFAALGLIGTNTMTITGLAPLTNYDFYIKAVDVFGQEVLDANATPAFPPDPLARASTLAASIEVTITDGIAEYPDSSFNEVPPPLTPALRAIRKTAIRVTLYVVAAGSQPDSVRLLVASTLEPGVGDFDMIVPGPAINPLVTHFYPCTKTGPNTWTGYIPETNPFIAAGDSVRFIVETVKGGTATYADSDSEVPGPGDVNNFEWTFAVSTSTKFKPWPTRILNNVITSKNPVAYPAYYLSEDAFVTITVYDIKGRPLVSLLDNAFRLGGQNIKEGGWRGINRSNRKLGVGLYYVNITAKSASSGKVILNSFQKVVIAR